MKLKFSFIFLILSFLIGCSTSKDTVEEQLDGTWIWIGSSGGIDGRTETLESTGITMKLQLSNNVVKKFNNANLIQELPYSIQLKESIIFGEPRKMLIYGEQSKQSFKLSKDTLTLYEECYDCFVSSYIRLSGK